jgi:transposase-like protein
MASVLPRQGTCDGWDEARKSALVSEIATAQLSVEVACERHGLRADVIQDWLRVFRHSALLAFDARLKQTLIAQGADAVLLSAAELTGTLADISIVDLLQSMQVAGKSAVISVTHAGVESWVWCSAGAVIDAESGRLTGEAALYRILSFDHGRVVAELRSTIRARVIHASTSQLLLEAERRKDEAARLWLELGDAQRFYRVTERAVATRSGLSLDEQSLLASVDAGISLRHVLEQSDLGDLETLTLLASLNDRQLIIADGWGAASAAAPSEAGDSMASFLILDGSRASERASSARFRGKGRLWGALGAVAVLVATTWFRFPSPAPEVPVGAALTQPTAPAAAPAARYAVVAAVEPSTAVLWLDRRSVATGQLRTSLPKDGRVHELRVVAGGYVPVILLFVDTPPPAQIRLEPLPSSPVATPPMSERKLVSDGKLELHRKVTLRKNADAAAKREAQALRPLDASGVAVSSLFQAEGDEPRPRDDVPSVEAPRPRAQVIE